MKIKFSLLCMVTIFLNGCGQSLKPGMITLYSRPVVNSQKDPSFNFTDCEKFSLKPIAEETTDTKMSPIIEKQLLFALRNEFEFLGYKYVENIEESDFYVGVVYSNEYRSQYIPPSSATIPWYVPGQTQTTYLNLYGSSGYTWGTATTTSPGYYIPMTFTRPGRYIGSYYPSLKVMAFEKKKKKMIWSGSSHASTPESDIRRSANILISLLCFDNFPKSNKMVENSDSNSGIFGCGFLIFTVNGNDYYPMVTGVWTNSPTSKSKLKPYDIILKINGKNTKNWPRSTVRMEFDKNQNDELSLTISRNLEIIEIILVAENETQVNLKKCKIIDLNSGITVISMKDALKSLGHITKEELINLIP